MRPLKAKDEEALAILASYFMHGRQAAPIHVFQTLGIELRAAFRLTRLGIHLLVGLLIVSLLFPAMPKSWRRIAKQRWSRQMVGMLGVKLAPQRLDLPPACLIVANHISWLDVFVINAMSSTHFVCKDDVRDWPFLGWLVTNAETIFIARGSRAAAARTASTLAERMQAGERVMVFPEGTTTNGRFMLPFRTALFEAAVSTALPVAPLALRYSDKHSASSLAPAYDGDITFGECMLSIARASDLRAHVQALSVIAASKARRDMAEQAELSIAAALNLQAPKMFDVVPVLAEPVAADTADIAH